MAIAAMGFGVVLHSVGLQMTLVAQATERHQMLLYASQVLEAKLSAGYDGAEILDAPIGFDQSSIDSSGDNEVAVPDFLYSVDGQPVTADPRIQQVTVELGARISRVRLSAYRLRIPRQ